MKYPSDRWIRYTPDRADLLVKVEHCVNEGDVVCEKAYWSATQYAPQGASKQITLGNGLIERWAFNPTRQQPWEIKIGTASSDSDRGMWQYAYCSGDFSGGSCANNNGNIAGQWNSPTTASSITTT